MHRLAVRIELGLQRLLILFAAWAMTGPLRLERHGRALCAVGLDRDVSQPLRNAQSWLLHRPTLKQENNCHFLAIVSLLTSTGERHSFAL